MLCLSLAPAVGLCGALTAAYVGSLYLWRLAGFEDLPRDHPHTIKKRMLSVLLVGALAPAVVAGAAAQSGVGECLRAAEASGVQPLDAPVLELMGLQWTGLGRALAVGVGLTAVLFFGPLVLCAYGMMYEGEASPLDGYTVLEAARNFVVGPLTEEWVFRAAMLPLLASSGLSLGWMVALCPLFFGVAHAHHVVEHLRKQGRIDRGAWGAVGFQVAYTTVFGMYAAYLFLRTGHFAAPAAAHVFCNIMGFPPFHLIDEHPRPGLIWACFGVGLLAFAVLVVPVSGMV